MLLRRSVAVEGTLPAQLVPTVKEKIFPVGALVFNLFSSLRAYRVEDLASAIVNKARLPGKGDCESGTLHSPIFASIILTLETEDIVVDYTTFWMDWINGKVSS